MDIEHAILRIKDHMEVHHMAESPRCKYITEALQMAINIMGAFEQVAWERNIAIKQLEELGLSLGQKVEYANVVPRKQYEDLREAFVDLICSGTNNPAPYCKNRRDECVDCYGYCTYNRCNGFNPDGRAYDN